MTKLRIEAAAQELKRLFSEGEQSNDAMWLSCAKCVLDTADAAAWRPSSSPPKTEDRVLILLKDGDQCTGKFENGSWYETLDGYGYEWDPNLDGDVAFWRYLPIPPTTTEPTI